MLKGRYCIQSLDSGKFLSINARRAPTLYPFSISKLILYIDTSQGILLALGNPNFKFDLNCEFEQVQDDIYWITIKNRGYFISNHEEQEWAISKNKTGDNQDKWLVRSAYPTKPTLDNLNFNSDIPQIEAAIKSNSNLDSHKRSVRAYYNRLYINTPEEAYLYTQYVPMICTNGDNVVILADNTTIKESIAETEVRAKYLLISPEERRKARNIVVTSVATVYAGGGYGTPLIMATQPWEAVVLSIAGAQFEMSYLEAELFLVMPGSDKYQEAAANSENIKVKDFIFLAPAFRDTVRKDIFLLTKAFSNYIGKESSGWLRLSALGMGYFAQSPILGDLKKYLLPEFIKGVIAAIPQIPTNITVIEMHDFFNGRFWIGDVNQPLLKVGRITFMHSSNKDLLYEPNPENKKYVIGLVNPADANSWKGNEKSSASLEAMIGNDTDIRVTQVPARNEHFTLDKFIAVSIY